MIKELTKNYLKNHNPTIIRICPGDSIHNVECLLIDTYHCYYWNAGDYHQDSLYHTSDIFEYNQYLMVSYRKSKDILIIDMAAFWDPNKEIMVDTISSKMLFREKKLKKLIKKCSKLNIK